ncbi:MAG: hypothetical protein ACF8XB_09125 [Planctomycetota bacterium JB042]
MRKSMFRRDDDHGTRMAKLRAGQHLLERRGFTEAARELAEAIQAKEDLRRLVAAQEDGRRGDDELERILLARSGRGLD